MIGQLRKILIFIVIFGWIFSGWLPIWQNPRIPPGIQKTLAAIILERTPSEANINSPVAFYVSATFSEFTTNFNGNEKWWNLAVYDDKNTYTSECFPTTEPLPNSIIFNLPPSDYVAVEIGAAVEKSNCENFNQSSYPLENSAFTIVPVN